MVKPTRPIKRNPFRSRKIELDWSKEMTHTLIREVEKRPFLWDTASEDYKNREVRDIAWLAICKVLQLRGNSYKEVAEVQNRWNSVRTNFRAALATKRSLQLDLEDAIESLKEPYNLMTYLLPIWGFAEPEEDKAGAKKINQKIFQEEPNDSSNAVTTTPTTSPNTSQHQPDYDIPMISMAVGNNAIIPTPSPNPSRKRVKLRWPDKEHSSIYKVRLRRKAQRAERALQAVESGEDFHDELMKTAVDVMKKCVEQDSWDLIGNFVASTARGWQEKYPNRAAKFRGQLYKLMANFENDGDLN